MINTIVAFNKLKKLLFKGVEFTDAKLKDNTLVQYEGELKEGTEVYVINEDGTTTIAEDKEYEMEDGSKFTIVSGKVSVITPAEPETVSETQTEPTEEVMEVIEPIVEVPSASIEERVSMIETKLAEILDAINKVTIEEVTEVEDTTATEMNKLKDEFKVISDLVNKLAELPVASTIEQKSNFSRKIETKEEEVQRMINEAIKKSGL